MNWIEFLPGLAAIALCLVLLTPLVVTPFVVLARHIAMKKRDAVIIARWELEDAVATVLARREAVNA